MERDFKGVWIPKEIFLNETLSWAEKILLIEIDSLDQNGQGCFASNEYLAKFVQVSEGSMANMIVKLMNKGYIIKKGFDGRKRYVSLNPDLIKILNLTSQKDESRVHKNMNSDFTKTLTQGSQKNEHINTTNKTISKTYNNNNADAFFYENNDSNLNDKKEKTQKKVAQKKETSFPENFSPAMVKAAQEFIEYRSEIKKPYKSQKSLQVKLEQWSQQIEKYGEAMVLDSITKAIANGWQGTFLDEKQIIEHQKNNKTNVNTNPETGYVPKPLTFKIF